MYESKVAPTEMKTTHLDDLMNRLEGAVTATEEYAYLISEKLNSIRCIGNPAEGKSPSPEKPQEVSDIIDAIHVKIGRLESQNRRLAELYNHLNNIV